MTTAPDENVSATDPRVDLLERDVTALRAELEGYCGQLSALQERYGALAEHLATLEATSTEPLT